MNQKHRYPIVSLRVTDNDLNQWQGIAKDLQTTVSGLLREALAEYLNQHTTRKGETP